MEDNLEVQSIENSLLEDEKDDTTARLTDKHQASNISPDIQMSSNNIVTYLAKRR